MAVKRIVPNIACDNPADLKGFYESWLGMDVLMDMGWIVSFGGSGGVSPQVSAASEGGSGTRVPDISIEVDNLDELIAGARDNGIAIEYGPVEEPWGVRRFYVRDPAGRLLNILSHI